MIAPSVRKAHRGANSRLGSRRHLIRMSAQPATAGSGAPLSSTPHPLTASLTACRFAGGRRLPTTRGGTVLAPAGARTRSGVRAARRSDAALQTETCSGSGEAGNCSPQKGAHKLRTLRPLARSLVRVRFTSSDVFFRALILQSTAHPQASRHPRRVPRLDPRASPAAFRLTRTGGWPFVRVESLPASHRIQFYGTDDRTGKGDCSSQ